MTAERRLVGKPAHREAMREALNFVSLLVDSYRLD
jgi:hypothetical protein